MLRGLLSCSGLKEDAAAAAATDDIYTIYLSSLYQAFIPLRGIAKIRYTKIYKDVTLPSPSVLCLFIGEYTGEVLPRPFTLSL